MLTTPNNFQKEFGKRMALIYIIKKKKKIPQVSTALETS